MSLVRKSCIKKIEKKKPDLIIKDISWSPSSPDKGDTIKFTVKIKNQGSGSAGSSTVKYYIDGSYVGSDSVSKLSAGSTSTETFTWTASKCGEVKVKAVADANKEVTETTGKNNDRTETVSIKCPTLKPDLIILDISWSPSSPDKGDKIKFTVKIKNQGSGSAGSSTVKYYIDGSYAGSDSVSKLSAGSTSTETFTWTASKCGNVKVKAVADANKDVTETTGKNNDRTETVSIKCPTLKPDLIIQDISWSPSNPDDGDTITFTVTIKNQGSGSAGSSTVKYYVDGTYVGYDSVPALSAGSTSTQTFTWTANKCGNVQVKAVADANNAVDEGSNDGNNDRTETINVICGEKPAPEIIKVSYPTTCVKEGEDATISVTVNNNGGASSEGYISVSFPHDEDVSVVSGTGSTYNKLYPKGSWIWNNKDQQMVSVDPLVELLDTNWVKGQQETITMNVKPNSGSDEIVFFVRAALKNNADGTYERDPTYSGYTDQQGWYVKKYVIEVCPKEAQVIIDDTTCVGYDVYVDGAYKLTDGDGDGSCTFSVAEGTHTIEIRDNGCSASIKRIFEGTYTWNSMPDSWCKGNAAVKFRGVIVKETYPISFYNYKVKIDEILEDPSGVLNPSDEVWVWAHADGPALVDSVGIDDQVEVYGTYDGELHREVKLETAGHYLRALKVSVIIDDDTCVGYEVWVDGAYKLTDGDGDGYCSFSVTEGTHTIEIRDNGRHTSITRIFEGTYTWNSMPDNWCKGNAAVKFKGVIVKDRSTSSFFNYKIKIDDVLTDSSDVLDPGDEVWVWAPTDANFDAVSIDDKVEVYGTYDGELHREVKLETGEHYLKEGSQEPGIIYVDDDFIDDPPNHKWNTIQEGINDAKEGDTVFVYSGIYYSGKWYGPISITKNGLKLIGEDRYTTIIDGNGEGDVITLRYNNTLISNFSIRNSCSGNCAGIKCPSSNNTIYNNTVSSNCNGIVIDFSGNNIIKNNLISDNSYTGMYVWLSKNNTIIENTISDNYIGINTHSMFCYNTYYHNNFIDNEGQADDSDWEENYWYNKELMEGNYWSDYEKKYPDAEDKDGNGIWDTPYEIPGREWAGRKDNYPLVRPYGKLKPDLAITDIWWDPENPKPGDEVTFYHTVTNEGNADASDFGDALYIDGEEWDITARGSLAADKSKERFSTHVWIASTGTHTIKVEADWEGCITESNKANNVLIKTLTVEEESLQISLSVKPNPTRDVDGATILAIVTSNGKPVEGAEVTITAEQKHPADHFGFMDDDDPSTPPVKQIAGTTDTYGRFQAIWDDYDICIVQAMTENFNVIASKSGYSSGSASTALTVKPYHEVPYLERPMNAKQIIEYPCGNNKVWVTEKISSTTVNSGDVVFLEIQIGRTVNLENLDIFNVPVFKNVAGYSKNEKNAILLSLSNTKDLQGKVLTDGITVEALFVDWCPLGDIVNLNWFKDTICDLDTLKGIVRGNWIGFFAGQVPNVIMSVATMKYGQDLGHGPEGAVFDPENPKVKIFPLSFGSDTFGFGGFRIKIPVEFTGDGIAEINTHVSYSFVTKNQYALNTAGAQFDPITLVVS